MYNLKLRYLRPRDVFVMDSYLGSFTVSAREDFMFGSVQSELYRHMIKKLLK